MTRTLLFSFFMLFSGLSIAQSNRAGETVFPVVQLDAIVSDLEEQGVDTILRVMFMRRNRAGYSAVILWKHEGKRMGQSVDFRGSFGVKKSKPRKIDWSKSEVYFFSRQVDTVTSQPFWGFNFSMGNDIEIRFLFGDTEHRIDINPFDTVDDKFHPKCVFVRKIEKDVQLLYRKIIHVSDTGTEF